MELLEIKQLAITAKELIGGYKIDRRTVHGKLVINNLSRFVQMRRISNDLGNNVRQGMFAISAREQNFLMNPKVN